MTGSIFDIQHGSVSDGDGIRTTVFLKGCPLRCKWCHNPESQTIKPQLMLYTFKCTACKRCIKVCSARSFDTELELDRSKCLLCGKCVDICPSDANQLCGSTAEASAIIAEVEEDTPFYSNGGGMTISGGEPSMQPNFSLELIALAKEHGIDTAIETCGYGDPNFFRTAAKLDATFLFDIKELDTQTHRNLTGVDNELILSNLLLLFDLNAKVVLRLPIIPGANDSNEEFDRLIEFALRHRGKYLRIEIIPYHRLGKSKEAALGIAGTDYDPNMAKKRASELAAMLGDIARVL